MSLKANYFKLGLFVIGAVVSGVLILVVIGSGRWFQPKLTIETYFNESVQGLDIGSKLKYRGVVIGEVTRIGFTYTTYQLDRPMASARATCWSRRRSSRSCSAGACRGRDHRPRERRPGGRAGAAGAAGAAGDHRDELPRDRLRRSAAAGAADRLDARQHLHPQRAVDGHRADQFGIRDHGPAAQARHREDAGEPQHAAGDDERAGSTRSTPRPSRSE